MQLEGMHACILGWPEKIRLLLISYYILIWMSIGVTFKEKKDYYDLIPFDTGNLGLRVLGAKFSKMYLW